MGTSDRELLSALGVPLPPGPLWTAAELEPLGFNAQTLQRLVRSGPIHKVRRGCYADASFWRGLGKREKAMQHIFAHARTCRGAGVYSDGTAARLHGLTLWAIPPLIHLTFSVKRSSLGQAPDVRNHCRRLRAQDIVQVNGLAVTSLERTVVDCAMSYEFQKALIIADHALRKGASRARIEDLLDSMKGHRGIKNARSVLKASDGRSESPGETLTRVLIARTTLPAPEPQLAVRSSHGTCRLDFGWKQQKVALEFDGNSKYFDYAPTPAVLLQERKRERALMEQGWRFVRLEWKDLFQPQDVERRLRAAFLRARSDAD